MAVQMTNEQLLQLLQQVQAGRPEGRVKHFTQCTARFHGTRTKAAVDEFITAADLFKTIEGISDKDAIEGLPLLLTGEANQWWNGVKTSAKTWKEATTLIRSAFAPQRPTYRLFLEIFNHPQPETVPTDQYITQQRDRFAQMSNRLEDNWQIDIIFGLLRHYIRDRISRTTILSFEDLLTKARAIEENERELATLTVGNEDRTTTTRKNVRAQIKCEYCRNFGHDMDVCRKFQKDKAEDTLTSTRPPAAISQTPVVHCYGCKRPGVYRRNCPDCNRTAGGKSSSNSGQAFCSLGLHPIRPRPRPAVTISVKGILGTAFVDTAACNSVASASLYNHLLSSGEVPSEQTMEVILADGSVKPTVLPTITADVVLENRTIKTTFVVLSLTENSRTLLGADFIEDSGMVPVLPKKSFYFIDSTDIHYPFTEKDVPIAPSHQEVQVALQEMKLLPLIEPMEEDDILVGYGPAPPSVIAPNPPAVFGPHGSWTVYQAPGKFEYMMADAINAIDDAYKGQGVHPPRTPLCSLQLRANEDRENMKQLLENYKTVFDQHGPPTPYSEHKIDTGPALLQGEGAEERPIEYASIRFGGSTGCSPALLMFGRELRTLDDVTNDLRHLVQSENFVAEATPRLLQLSETWDAARESHCEEEDDLGKTGTNQDQYFGSEPMVLRGSM